MTKLTPFPSRQICGISFTWGKEFRKYWPKIFESEEDKATDGWRRAQSSSGTHLKFMVCTISSVSLSKFRGYFLVKWVD